MVLETVTAMQGVEWNSIIIAAIGLVSGGAILKLYEAGGKRKQQGNANERSFMNILQSRIVELEDKVDLLTDKITSLMESSAKVVTELIGENATLVSENKGLREKVRDLESKN